MPSAHEATLLQHLALIDRIAAAAARRLGMSGDDAAELTSWIRLRLVEDDYAAFRKFRGESSMATYLTVVIAMLSRDYRVQRWGRWRPSASARRRGSVAVRLETLVHRHGYPLDQAAQVLRTSGETQMSDRELATLLSQLPPRMPLRPVEVGEEPLNAAASAATAEVLVATEDSRQERERAERALHQAMHALPVEDRLILRLRFWEALGVADIARALGLDQKPLYRRMERLLAVLRDRLTRTGITPQVVAELIAESLP